MKKIISCLALCFLTFFCSAQSVTFDSLVHDFFVFRMDLALVDDMEEKINMVEEYEKNIFASDYPFSEQEKIVMQNYIVMEIYNARFALNHKSKETQELMKNQKDAMDKWLSENKDEEKSKYFLCTYGDIISCMMSFSVADVMKYGLSVKGYYLKSLEVDPDYCYAKMNLAQWYFWAPKIAGGSKARANEIFEEVYQAAKTPDEIYFCGIMYSQSLFEAGNRDKCRELLEKCQEILPESKVVAELLKLNAEGYSMYDGSSLKKMEL